MDLSDMSTDSDEYNHQLMNVFEPIIKKILVPSHVSPSLTSFLSGGMAALQKIRKEERLHGPEEASELLLRMLHESNVQGWFTAFLISLRENEFDLLADIITGTRECKYSVVFVNLVSTFGKRLISEISPFDILPDLVQSETLSKQDQIEIQNQADQETDMSGMVMLLDRLPKRTNYWFPDLIAVLRKGPCGYQQLAKDMAPVLFKVAEGSIREMAEEFLKLNERPLEYIHVETCQDNAEKKKICTDAASCSSQRGMEINEDEVIEEPVLQHTSMGNNSLPLMAGNMEGSDPDGREPSSKGHDFQTATSLPLVTDAMSQLQLRNQSPSPSHKSNTMINQSGPMFDEERTARKNYEADQNRPMPNETSSVNAQGTSAATYCSVDTNNLTMSLQGDKPIADKGLLNISDPTVPTVDERLEINESNENAAESISEEEPSDVVQPERLELRSYQEELAKPAIDGENTIIVAPTGSGKTHVALSIIQHHMEALEHEAETDDDPDDQETGKVVFFVPTVELVNQQYVMFRKYLNQYKTYDMSGEVQDSQRVPLTDLIRNNDIIIMTPQILVDNLDKGTMPSLGVFTLMVFDECHHATKAHPYNTIMTRYLKEKYSETFIPPQVVGLTASVGVGKARDTEAAKKHILSLCANLDAQGISTVSENINELDKFVNKPNEEKIETHGRSSDPFKLKINKVMSTIERRMREFIEKQNTEELAAVDQMLQTPASRRGCDPYIQWHSRLQKSVAVIHDQGIRRMLYSCLSHLKVYNLALVINDDCRTRDALDFVLKQFEEIDQKHKDDTDKWLDALFNNEKSYLEEVSQDAQYKNPKLEVLKKELERKYRENEDMRAIIFCKTRDMTVAMKNWMDNTDGIKDLNPHRIVGAATSAEKGGMTQSKHEDVLKYFKEGKHKVMIATSVAEEGLDVSKCNLVIRYEYVTNEIAMVQSRGRGRAEGSDYLVLGDATRGASKKEELNKIREKMMNEAIKSVRRMDAEQRKKIILDLQREAQVERKMTEAGKRVKDARRSRGRDRDWELRCIKCNKYSCMAADVRQVEQSHHVVLDESFDDRIIIEPHPNQKDIGDLKKTDKIFCKECRYDWGIRAIYKGSTFCVIKVVSFIIINLTTNRRDACKKWKDIPFAVDPLTPEELELYANAISTREAT